MWSVVELVWSECGVSEECVLSEGGVSVQCSVSVV